MGRKEGLRWKRGLHERVEKRGKRAVHEMKNEKWGMINGKKIVTLQSK